MAEHGWLGRFFLLKTTFARLLLIVLAMGGTLAGVNMVKEGKPDLNIATATITTAWGAADAATIEQRITTPLERQFKEVPDLQRMVSGSFQGFSIISLQFEASAEPREAMEILRAELSEARGILPKEADEPVLKQFRLTDVPVFSVRLTGNVDVSILSELARSIAEELERLTGVNEAETIGDREEVVMVRLIGARMDALGISSTQVAGALRDASLNMPWGRFDGEDLGAFFRFRGRFGTLDELGGLPVRRSPNGQIITLSQIADISRTLAEERTRTFFSADGAPFETAVEVSLTRQSGADAIEVVERARMALEARVSREDWPEGVSVHVVTDESEDIVSNLSNVAISGGQAMLAVFLVLFVSLTWREALMAGLAIPVTFGGALIVLSAMGSTLNEMVIIGMVIALGLLVDVFILMLEGLHDGIYVRGRDFRRAAMETVRTYAAPALSGTLTTVFAMAPLIGIEGTPGKFIRPLPVTAIICLAAAFAVALLLVVPLSRHVLPKSGTTAGKTRMDRLSATAGSGLNALLRARFVATRGSALAWVAAALVVFGLSAMAFRTLPSELIGKTDGLDMGILIEMEPETSLASSQRCADGTGEVLRALPFFRHVTKYVGRKSPFSTPSLADRLSAKQDLGFVGFTGTFIPRNERDRIAHEYEDDIRDALLDAMHHCPGGRLQLTMPAGETSSESPVQIILTGGETEVLREISADLIAALKDIPGARNVRDNLGLLSLDIVATPRMEALNFYGVPVQDLASQVRFLMSNDKVGEFELGGVDEDLDIRMGFAWPSRGGTIGGPTMAGELQLFNIVTPSGGIVSLGELVDLELRESALTILHENGQRALTVLSDTSGRTAGEVLADLKPTLEALAPTWPEGYSYTVGGEAADSAQVFGSAGVMMALALVLIFALLVIQFDNFVQPFIVMSAIPLALTGTFMAFYTLDMTFSFMSMVGIIALIGIVVNNSIVMIETMNEHRERGLPVSEAAAHGAADRLRPILTTSITTVIGMIPLSLSDPLWLPLGVTIIGGLVFSTALSLFIVPCLYRLLTRERLRIAPEGS